MTIYGNKINFDLKEYLAEGHSITELAESVEAVGLDVVITSHHAYAGVICGKGHSVDGDSYEKAKTQFADLCEELPYALAGTKGLWIIDEEEILV